MEIIVIDNYIHISKLGTKITAIALNFNGIWKDLPLDSTTYTLDETHPLSIELRQWEKSNYPILQSPNWKSLITALRGTQLFAKTYAAAKDNSKVAIPFGLLVSTLNSISPTLADLEFALSDIKSEMESYLDKGDIEFINTILHSNFFPISI